MGQADDPTTHPFALAWVLRYPTIDLHCEYKFHPYRKWRFDYVHFPAKVAIEIDGKQCHTSWSGYLRDREKDLEAMLLGWLVVRIPNCQCTDDRKIKKVRQLIERREACANNQLPQKKGKGV